MHLTIREATEEDYDELCSLYAEVDALHSRNLPRIFRDVPGPARPRQYIFETIASEDALLLVAEDAGRVVGLLHAEVRPVPEYDLLVPRRFAHIGDIVVTETYRGHGVGRRLMEHAHRWAGEKGLSEVELNVFEFNRAAVTFYEELGYETTSRRMHKTLG